MRKHDISEHLQLFDLRYTEVDLQTIGNRRFMYHSSGLLILGEEESRRKSSGRFKSHAEEYGNVLETYGCNLPPFDEFARGWIGTGKDYPDGIIHFAPHITSASSIHFNPAFDFIEAALENGYNKKGVLRGFVGEWEQKISAIIPDTELKKTRLNDLVSDATGRVGKPETN